MGAPPVNPGGTNATLTCPGPTGVSVWISGTPGGTGSIRNVRVAEAGRWVASPAWVATTVQLPACTKASRPSLVTVHTSCVGEAKVTGSPESARADSTGTWSKRCVPTSSKSTACSTCGTTGAEGADGALVPAAAAAVRVKV